MDTVYHMPTDTPGHIMEKQHAIIMQKTLLERLQMCADMTEFFLAMLERQIKLENNNIEPNCLKFEMIKLLYADCFSEDEFERIGKHFAGLLQNL